MYVCNYNREESLKFVLRVRNYTYVWDYENNRDVRIPHNCDDGVKLCIYTIVVCLHCAVEGDS